MRKIYSATVLAILFMAGACKKNENVAQRATGTIFAINTAVDAGAVKVRQTDGAGYYYSRAANLAYSSSGVYPAFTGSQAVTVVSSTDSTKTLLNRTVEVGTTNTLYLIGQSPNIEGLYVAETSLPNGLQGVDMGAEKVIYVRFANMSPNSAPLDVKLTGGGTSEFAGLAYKSISPFKKYAANLATATAPATPNYVFEVWNPATNTKLASVTVDVNANRFRTISLVLNGLVGGTGTNAFGVLQVNYFN